jgi:serine/threonine protein kinase
MNAEPRQVTKPEIWTEWERRIVNGVYPLRRFLGGSDHSGVFLTDYKAGNLPEVAIKFVPADTVQTEVQLVQWGTAGTLSHPHLLRLFDVGRCQVRGRAFLFVVMEYAEQTLAQLLPTRALTPDEVREMLLPTLDALAFLHRNQLVQGQVKPSNLLVVNDQLKLASDTVRPVGNSASGTVRTSLYDSPELQHAGYSTAGDVWGLGITLVEALTQRTPTWTDERSETASWPASLPGPFVDTVQRCLSHNPANRPTVAELETQYKPAAPAQVASVPQPPAREATREAAPSQKIRKRRPLLPVVAAALLISLGVWVGLRSFQQHSNSRQSSSDTSQTDLQQPDALAAPEPDIPPPAVAPAAAAPAASTASAATASATPVPAGTASAARASATPAPAASAQPAPAATSTTAKSTSELSSPASRSLDQSSPPLASNALSVLHEVSPDVPQRIRDRIRGHVKVTVRVLVGPSGDVVGEFLESTGPSRYFARIAGDAAGEWKFAPADTQGRRVWLLRFDFDRGGVAVQATAAQ